MSKRKKILFFSSRIPFPLEKGDKLRVYHQMKHFSVNHEVYLCVVSSQKLEESAKKELEKFCTAVHVYESKPMSVIANLMVALFAGLPFQVGYFFNSGAHYFVQKLIEQIAPDHVFVQLIRMSEYAKNIPNIPKTLDYMDSFSMGMERRKATGKGIKKLLFGWENKRLKKYEESIYPFFDHHLIISEQDKKSLQFSNAQGIHVVPNGVDDSFFRPNSETSKKYDLIFTGNMSYPPNVAAVEKVAKEILPLIWETKPDCNFLIAGANPSSAVKSLACDRIKVTGWVDDIRTCYNEGKICLAPLDIGTGLQNKILEAMSMEIPCITSALANNALKATPEKEILIGSSPEEYKNHVLRLLSNPMESINLGKAGKQFVTTNYNWESTVNTMKKIMEL